MLGIVLWQTLTLWMFKLYWVGQANDAPSESERAPRNVFKLFILDLAKNGSLPPPLFSDTLADLC